MNFSITSSPSIHAAYRDRPIRFCQKALLTAALLLAAITPSACRRASTPYITLEGVVWHTTYRIVCQTENDPSALILDAMQQVEQSLSPFIVNSTISKINRNESRQVDSLIVAVFDKSQEICRLSSGAFDPTVAPLVNLWGFGYGGAISDPTDDDIRQRLESVGLLQCYISNGEMHKKSDTTEFNFSAITKGFGVDRVAQALQMAGITNYMIEIGGEVAVSGVSADGNQWKIGIDFPTDDPDTTRGGATTIQLSDAAIATSGNYRNYRLTGSGRVGHTISPVTGHPVATTIASATVVAPTCMEADALATAMLAMKADAASAMIKDLGNDYGAIILEDDGHGGWTIDRIGRCIEPQ